VSNKVPTGQGKPEKVRELEWSGETIFLEKSGEMKKVVPPDVTFSG